MSLLALAVAGPLQAGPIEDNIVRQLRAQGYRGIEVRRTLLGRSRIIARSARTVREIVVNPITGEILRDVIRRIDPGSEGGGSGNVGGPRSGNDDDDDDDDDDDGDDGGDDGGGDDGGGDDGGGDDD